MEVAYMISQETLLQTGWRFARSSGEVISDNLKFQESGVIDGYPAAETRWSLDDSCLSLFLPDGTLTTSFSRIQATEGAGTRLIGRFVLDPNVLIYHFLDQHGSATPARESRLNLSGSLSFETDTLLIIANSAGRFSEGFETRWEFFDLPAKLGLDHLRLAETRSPTLYYLDKINLLLRTIGGVIGCQYKRVILAGLSSGAFISLVLAELLSAEYPQVEFHSFSVNPQTAHSGRNRKFIADFTPLGSGPDLLDDNAVAMSDLVIPDVATLAIKHRDLRRRLAHTIFYDSLNIVEGYYCSLVSDLPNFHMRPVPLNLPHMLSCIGLFESGLIQKGIEDLIRSKIAAD